MSCERYREKISDALAGGAVALSENVAAHVRACAGCREFYEAQKHLFGAMDTGVRAMVNEAVPASLLPRVRARMEEVRTRRLDWRPAWGVVAIVGMILLIGFGFVRQSGPAHDTAATKISMVAPVRTETNLSPAPQRKAVSAPANPKWRPRNKTETRVARPAEDPEVIVLAEEREAFARLVARIPVDPQKAVALTRPAPPQPDLPVEIALLQIENLQVKLLEPTVEE